MKTVDVRNLAFFLDRANNRRGQPISGENRVRLLAAIERPSLATWEDAYGIILEPTPTTLWMGVLAVQGGSKTRSILNAYGVHQRWINLPTPREVYAGLRFVTS